MKQDVSDVAPMSVLERISNTTLVHLCGFNLDALKWFHPSHKDRDS